MFALPDPVDNLDKYDEPRLHLKVVMAEPLVTFDLSLRILIPLENAGIRRVGDLAAQTPQSLKKVRMLGAAGIAQLQRLMDFLGLEWGMEKGRHC